MANTIVIGPHFLSGEEIRRANEKLASGSKGHRLLAIVPLLLIGFVAKGLMDHPSPIRVGIILVPEVVLLLGLLLLRPYREIHRVAWTYVLSDESLTLECRVDGRRPDRTVIPWKDIVGVEDADDAVVFRLRSGDAPRLFKECFDNHEQLQALVSRAQGE